MRRLTWEWKAEPVSLDQILRRKRGQGNVGNKGQALLRRKLAHFSPPPAHCVDPPPHGISKEKIQKRKKSEE